MKALIGRARDEALQAELRRRSIQCSFLKLLDIEPTTPPDLAARLHQAKAVLLTSANAVPALRGARPAMPVLAVGDATAATAREAGFARVESAGGDATALAALVRRRIDPAAGPLLYLRGADVAGDLVGQLAGFNIDQAIVYRVQPVAQLPATVREELARGAVDLVVLFSPRSAAGFVSLLSAAALTETARKMALLALSPAVAQAAELPWAAVHVARHPSRQGLLETIEAMGKSTA